MLLSNITHHYGRHCCLAFWQLVRNCQIPGCQSQSVKYAFSIYRFPPSIPPESETSVRERLQINNIFHYSPNVCAIFFKQKYEYCSIRGTYFWIKAGYCSITHEYWTAEVGYWESEPSGLPESAKRAPKAHDVLVLKQHRCFAFPTPMFLRNNAVVLKRCRQSIKEAAAKGWIAGGNFSQKNT